MTTSTVVPPSSSMVPHSSSASVSSGKKNGKTVEDVEEASPLQNPDESSKDSTQQALPTKSNDASPSLSDLYGLKGMLKVIRTNNVDLNILAVGTDLTALGLNLHNNGNLSSQFVSPILDEQPPKEDLELTLPPQYYINSPALKMTRLQNLTPETLMYIFYTIVGSLLQGYAAAELYNRRWVYHTIYRKWFTTAAAQKQEEQGFLDIPRKETEWIYFEPMTWKKCSHSGYIDEASFMKPNDLRELLNNFVQHLCSPGTTLNDVNTTQVPRGTSPNGTVSQGHDGHPSSPLEFQSNNLPTTRPVPFAVDKPGFPPVTNIPGQDSGQFFPRASSMGKQPIRSNFVFPNRTPPAPPPGFGHTVLEKSYPQAPVQNRSSYNTMAQSLFYRDLKNVQPSSRETMNST